MTGASFSLSRQGCYSAEGSIVILCAYLGQLLKVRDALKGEIAVVIGEKDQDALDAYDDGDEKDRDANIGVERVNVTQRVCHKDSVIRYNLLIKLPGSDTLYRQLPR